MASNALLDIEALLLPISEDAPTGIDCREDPSPLSDYQTVKSARNAARAEERNNVFSGGGHEAEEHWRKVLELSPKILTEQSKDLEVLCWYAEALVRRYSFAGLRDSFKVLQGFTEQYWDHLYPMPDEDGIETRVAPLAGLNGEGAEGVLIAPLRNREITEGNSVGPFTFWEYQQVLEIQRMVDEDVKEKKFKDLGHNLDDIEKAILETRVPFLVDLRDDLSDCVDIFKQVSRKLDELCGIHESPPTSNIINVLEECLGAVTHLGKDKFPVEEIPSDEDVTEGENTMEEGAPASAAKAVSGPVASREQAFKQLLEISEFFLKTEPHSPVSYLLQKAVKWGNMPLFELMQELIPEQNALDHYSMLTGVKTED